MTRMEINKASVPEGTLKYYIIFQNSVKSDCNLSVNSVKSKCKTFNCFYVDDSSKLFFCFVTPCFFPGLLTRYGQNPNVRC